MLRLVAVQANFRKRKSAVCLLLLAELPDVDFSSRVTSRPPDLRSVGSANLDHIWLRLESTLV